MLSWQIVPWDRMLQLWPMLFWQSAQALQCSFLAQRLRILKENNDVLKVRQHKAIRDILDRDMGALWSRKHGFILAKICKIVKFFVVAWKGCVEIDWLCFLSGFSGRVSGSEIYLAKGSKASEYAYDKQ